MKLEPATLILAAAAVASTALVALEPFSGPADGGFVSTTSAARRLFPELAAGGAQGVQVTLEPTDGASVQLRPGPDGYELWVDGLPAGPVDPDALEGLLSSLRMATSLRAVAEDTDVGPAVRGSISVAWDDQVRELEVGGATPDDVGLYGTLVEKGREPQAWVIEPELAALLDQRPGAWLARRAAVVDARQVERVDFGEGAIERGPDGLWRSIVQGRAVAILDTEAVEIRLDRMLSTRLDPLLAEGVQASPQRWVGIGATGDRRFELSLAGPCPGDDSRVVLVRGPGWPGCIDSAVTRPWPLDPTTADSAGQGLVEPRLLPHPYGRVLRIDVTQPESASMRQQLGDWVIETPSGTGSTIVEVERGPVYEWYTSLHEAEVELDPSPAPLRADVDLRVVTDSTVQLRLRCELGQEVRCQRDEGPILRVLDPLPSLRLEPETFTPRKLLEVAVEDVRAVELLPGPAGDSVRQAAHFDLGVWRLDAPRHPDGDAALNETALEGLLATVSSLRAESFERPPASAPQRTIRVEMTPRRGQAAQAAIELHPGCVAVVDDKAATLSEAACTRLQGDLLHDDPLEYWVQTARSIEIDEGDLQVRLKRDQEALLASEGDGEAALARLQSLAAARVEGLEAGEPPGAPEGSLRILPASGSAFFVDYGPGWAAVRGADWFYRMSS